METNESFSEKFQRLRPDLSKKPGLGFTPITSIGSRKLEHHCIDLIKIHNILGYSLNYMLGVEEEEASESDKQSNKRNSQPSNTIKSERKLELKSNVLSSVEKINTELTSIYQELQKMEGYIIELESHEKERKTEVISAE